MHEYCTRHNYEFIEINHMRPTKISPYWLRVKDLVDLSNSYDENTIFVYMDLDTCINPSFLDRPMSKIIHSLDSDNEWHMYIGKDSNPFKVINSGVMIIKNTRWSKDMIKLWLSKYKSDKWSISNGRWMCMDNKKECSWAGDNYEQGELEKLYKKNVLNAKSNIAILHSNLLSNWVKANKNSFIYHLMRWNDNDRAKFFKKLYFDYKKTITF